MKRLAPLLIVPDGTRSPRRWSWRRWLLGSGFVLSLLANAVTIFGGSATNPPPVVVPVLPPPLSPVAAPVQAMLPVQRIVVEYDPVVPVRPEPLPLPRVLPPVVPAPQPVAGGHTLTLIQGGEVRRVYFPNAARSSGER
jgi:hypothetical protein